ncbi:MAG TPA: hypothetical protein VGV35_05755 [Bryobacteraceae bacterium]|nr:hypothetical protein [Bryobacteraceae bacterium]
MIARTIAAVLLSLFGGSLAVPFVAPDLRPALPPCCRRDGKHHCAMTDMIAAADETPSVRPAPCPLFPKQGVTANIASATPAPPTQVFVTLVLTEPAAKAQTEALYRISHSRSRQKRGPPSLSEKDC